MRQTIFFLLVSFMIVFKFTTLYSFIACSQVKLLLLLHYGRALLFTNIQHRHKERDHKYTANNLADSKSPVLSPPRSRSGILKVPQSPIHALSPLVDTSLFHFYLQKKKNGNNHIVSILLCLSILSNPSKNTREGNTS